MQWLLHKNAAKIKLYFSVSRSKFFLIKAVVPIDIITVGTARPDELGPEMFVDLGLSVETQKTIVR